MKVKKCEDVQNIKKPVVYATVSGNVIDVVETTSRRKQTIEKLSKENYLNLTTGEIGVYEHAVTRKDNKQSVYRSLKRLRQLINANLTDYRYVRWVTLTYAENMTDTTRLYNDYRAFWQRFKRYCKSIGYENVDYILANEPQGRGAWHMHILFIFDRSAPFIANEKLRQIWGQGFVSINKIDDKIDNFGAYLTAYLGDMEVSEDKVRLYQQDFDVGNIKEIQGEKCSKYVLKGARLTMYPVGFNIFKCSRGIKQPEKIITSRSGLKKIVGDSAPTYEKSYILESENDENSFSSQICIKQYKLKKVK